MKKLIIAAASAVTMGFVALAADRPDGGVEVGAKTVKYAPKVYWATGYSGKSGIQVGNVAAKPNEPRMMLGGEPLYVTGVNCYNLFVQCHESDGMNTTQMENSASG